MQEIDLDTIRQERLKCLGWKNIQPYWEAIQALPTPKNTQINFNNFSKILESIFSTKYQAINQAIIAEKNIGIKNLKSINQYLKYSIVAINLIIIEVILSIKSAL